MGRWLPPDAEDDGRVLDGVAFRATERHRKTRSRLPPQALAETESDWLSLRQTAKKLHVAERVLRQAVRTGELPASKPGKRTLRIHRNDAHQWMHSRRVPTWRDRHGPKA